MNVTVKGNYTKLEAQYTATLLAYYADNSDGVSRKITGNVSTTAKTHVSLVTNFALAPASFYA